MPVGAQQLFRRLDLARLAGARRICFFHHDPASSDARLTDLYERAVQYKELTYRDPEIDFDLGSRWLGDRGLTGRGPIA